jgi:CRISPR/Cas system CSM-associated protein Csm5 (group 7 of RAMP superfamily)
MNLDDFIDFIEEYETSFNKAKSISSYSIGFGGGCATKNDA